MEPEQRRGRRGGTGHPQTHWGEPETGGGVFFLKHVRVVRGEMSIGALVAELLASKKRDGGSVRYLHDLRVRLGIFAAAFPEQKLVDFSQPQIDDWLRAYPCGPRGRNNYRRLIVVAFNFAVGRGYCLDNPAKGTSEAKEANRPPGILTPEQTTALLNAATDDVLPALVIQAFAGLRVRGDRAVDVGKTSGSRPG